MFTLDQAFNYIRMIDEDELLTATEVCIRYSAITPEILKRAVTGDELPVLNIFGAEYHWIEAIQLYLQNQQPE